jgi:TRAP-type C4-dicarboxylate transport system substrate-binding protein
MTFVVLAAAVAGASLSAQVVRLATQAPSNSEWHNALREFGDKVLNGTAKRVRVTVYPDGGQGSEKTVVDKIVSGGSVNAAFLTAVGMTNADEGFNVFGMPFFIQSDEEMRYVRTQLTPILTQRLAARGLHLLCWGEAGWVQLFSKTPLKSLADVKRVKLFTTEGNDRMVQWYRANGFNPVAMPETEIITQLTALNGVEAVPFPPYAANLLGLQRYTPHMLELQVAPLVGAAVISKAVWDRMSEADRAVMTAAAAAMEQRVNAKVPALDRSSIATMQSRGLTVTKLDGAAAREFRAAADQMTESLANSLVPKEVLDIALRARTAFRKGARTPQPAGSH